MNSAAAGLRAGVARRDITPEPGLALIGFGVRQGPPAALGTHDPLHLLALAAGSGDATVVLLAYDLLGLTADWVAGTRAAVERATGVPANAQMYTTTHTHCGPGTGAIPYVAAGCEPVDPSYMVLLSERTVEAVREALDSMVPATLRLGAGRSFIGWNRRSMEVSPQGPRDGGVDDIDPLVLVADFVSERGAKIGTIVNYACHATSTNESYYSADFPGYARKAVEEAAGGLCLYVNGAGADIDPRESRAGSRSYSIAERRGHELGRDAVAAIDGCVASGSTLVAAAQATATLVYGHLTTADEAERIRAEGLKALEAAKTPEERAIARSRMIDYAERVLAARDDLRWNPGLAAEVQGLRIGDLAIISFPVEFFSEDGRRVREASPAPSTMNAGWSNGLWGYTPTRRAMRHGGYEVETAFKFYGHPAVWDPASGDSLRRAAASVAARLFGGREPGESGGSSVADRHR